MKLSGHCCLSSTLVVLIAATALFFLFNHVHCQSVTKSIYYTSANCTGLIYATFYMSSSCSGGGSCNSISLSGSTVYYKSECASEIPTSATLNNINANTYKNASLFCTGALKSTQITPLGQCIIEFGTSYFSILDGTGTGSKTYYTDSLCTKKLFTSPLFIGTCLSGSVMYVSGGSGPQPPQPPQPTVQYQKVIYYNSTMESGASCSNAVNYQVYRPSTSESCVTQSQCQLVVDGTMNGEKYSQIRECTTVVPSSPSFGYLQISSHADQSSCNSQQSLSQFEIYPINVCSPYSLVSNSSTEIMYIKSDNCTTIRKFNDSSCLNFISKIDLTSNLNVCGSNGVKYMCNFNSGNGGGGSAPGKSTRANDGMIEIHSWSIVMMSILLGLISIMY